jgi:hypothetical protein
MQRKRRDRLESALSALEVEFRAKLIEALRRCEAGYWGLFGQNDHTNISHRIKSELYVQSGAAELDALGSDISRLRDELCMTEPFALYAQLLERRGRKDENSLGEARLAAAWLQELDA